MTSEVSPFGARAARLLIAACVALFASFVARPSRAHAVGVSRGEYRRVATGLEVTLAFARNELSSIGGGSRVLDRIDVRTTTPCRATLSEVRPLERDGLEIAGRFRCDDAGALRVSLAPLLRDLTRGHRHEAKTLPGGSSTLLYEARPSLALEVEDDAPADAAPLEASPKSGFLEFVRLGVEHILTGYDHLVFLLGLVIVGLGTRRTLVVASAFTLAHSLSLAVSVLGGWSPKSSLVEPAIALSIAYVGIENLVAKSHERRSLLAFGFGLIHGFGFASALDGVRFRGLELAGALGGFNLGVELGQIAALGVLLPLVGLLRARPAFARYAVPAVSAAVAVSGVAWLVV